MSIEYHARFPHKLTGEMLTRIEEDIARKPGWSLIGSLGAKFRMKLEQSEPRDVWPEDVTIEVNEEEMLITVHSATRQERQDLISYVDAALRAHGVSSSLEEV